MHLWLLRHGDALHRVGKSDTERPLSPLGRKQARRIGSFLAKQAAMPHSILCSPLLRAQQTAQIVSSQCNGSALETTDALLSGASHTELLRDLHSRSDQHLLLVGHEPLMSAFTSMLAAGHPGSFIRFSPCTLALVTYTGRARPNGGTLELILSPESLMRNRPSPSEKRP